MDSPIISPQWLKNHLKDDNLVILHCSMKPIPEEWIGRYIPRSRFFDLKGVFRDLDNDLPNSFPSAEKFQQGVQELGINKDSTIVVYDAQGVYSSPRVYYLFRSMGHENVAILNGGLPGWKELNGQIVNEYDTRYSLGDFEAKFDESKYIDMNQVESNINAQDFTVLDARSKGRFDGTAPEPRPGLKSGHIPNSKSLAFTEVLENGRYKSKEDLEEIFKNLELENQPMVFSCGSGITACISMIAMEMVSDQATAVFDGSWTEWALAHQ